MATNVFGGREAKLTVSATSSVASTAGVKFGALQDWNLTVDRSDIMVVHQESSAWNMRLPGIATWSMTANTVYLSTAATINEQDTLRASLTGATRKYYMLKNSTAAGSQTFSGWGYVTGYGISGGLESPQLHNFTIMGDGKITEAT